jgi:nucleotide-binding universal stress UspA family protein
MNPLNDYRTIVVGTDGSELAGPTVARAAWLARHDDADLVIICALSDVPRREEARIMATLGGDGASPGQVIGREAASRAIASAVTVAQSQGATIAAALLLDGDPAAALLETAEERDADLIVVGASGDVSLAERLLGTVSGEVVRRAPCEVLVVRERQRSDVSSLAVQEEPQPAI